MYLKSYKYYTNIYGESPSFHRGLGKKKILVKLCFFVSGIILSPLRLVLGEWLYGEKRKTGNEIVEFIFGTTHEKISKNIELECVDRFYFNFNKKRKDHYSDKRILIISLIHGLEVFKLLMEGERHPIAKLNGVRLIKMVGLGKLAQWHMTNYKVYVQYNDHIPYNIMLEKIARANKLKTVYIQHAPVSYKFPPLFHDFNVLFSEDSLEKYKTISGGLLDVKYKILFDVRFPLKKIEKSSVIDTVLVCFNKIDNLEKVAELVNVLKNEGFKVVLRPHPEDYREFYNFENVQISKGNSIWEDLLRCTYVIVNESAVPLESIYYHKPTYKLSCLDYSFHDNYGFLENKLLTKEYNFIEELIKDIKRGNIPNDHSKLKYYIGDTERRFELLDQLRSRISAMLN